MPAPTVKVEIGFASAPDAAQTWTDVTAYVRGDRPIECSHGRSDEKSTIEPGRASLLLDNDGRFTFGNGSGAYSPNVLPGKRVRISVSADGGGTWWPRFDGYVDGWPVGWGPNASYAVAEVTATDRLARWSRLRTLRDAMAEELGAASYSSDAFTLGTSALDGTDVLAGGVHWLYALQEQSGSTTAGDSSGQGGRPTLTLRKLDSEDAADTNVEFGVAGLAPEGTMVKFTPNGAGDGWELSPNPMVAGDGWELHSDDVPCPVGSDYTLFAVFAWEPLPGAVITDLGDFVSIAGARLALIATDTTVYARIRGADAAVNVTKTVSTGDGALHFAVLTVSGDTASLYVDDLSAATADISSAGTRTSLTGLTIGIHDTACWHQVSWVGMSKDAMSATRVADLRALALGEAERSDLRVARVLRWLDLASDATLETGLSDVAYQATGGRTGLDIINELNAVEQGAFFADGRGVFQFQSRDHRYNVAPGVTLDATQVALDRVAVDTTSVVNDVTYSRSRGATHRAINTSSVTAYGPRTEVATVYAATDEALAAAAEWRVNRYAGVAPRVPQVTVDLLGLDAATAASVLSLEVGSKVRLTDLPSTTPGGSTTVDLWVEGVADRVGVSEWSVVLATSPVGVGIDNVLELDSTTYGLLDTAVLAY